MGILQRKRGTPPVTTNNGVGHGGTKQDTVEHQKKMSRIHLKLVERKQKCDENSNKEERNGYPKM